MITISQLAPAVISSVDAEFLRLTGLKEDATVLSFMSELYYSHKLHTMFIGRNLVDLTDMVFANEPVRDFILETTIRLSLTLQMENIDVALVASVISNGFSYAIGAGSGNLIHSDMFNTIAVDRQSILETLISNTWLLAIILVLYFFEETSIYKILQAATLPNTK